MLFSSVALCEYPSGCPDDATCRVIVRLVGKNVETYEYYCDYHCAIAERAARSDDRFELVDASPY